MRGYPKHYLSNKIKGKQIREEENDLLGIFYFKKRGTRRRNKWYLCVHEKSVPTMYDFLVKEINEHSHPLLWVKSDDSILPMYTGIFQGIRRINYIKVDEDNIPLKKKQRNHEVLAICLSVNRPRLYPLLLFEH